MYLNRDCKGIGMMCPSDRTSYGNFTQLVGAFVHHMKVQILGNAFNVPVKRGDIFRGRVFEDGSEKVFVTCTLLNCNDGFEGIRTVEKSEYATEKHKLV